MLFALDGVSALRGATTVLHDLTLGLEEGATSIVGPSGCGKSTLLRLLNRLADPDAGSVAYRGRDLRAHDVLALRREVALVAQVPALIEGTVVENVELGPRLAGRRADVPGALRLAGLDPGLFHRDAGRLSVGEQQRVMLARALALEPAVLLLDEPTSALDEASQAAVEQTLRDLRARLAVSLVLVTHDPAQARRLGDRVVTLDGGRVGER